MRKNKKLYRPIYWRYNIETSGKRKGILKSISIMIGNIKNFIN